MLVYLAGTMSYLDSIGKFHQATFWRDIATEGLKNIGIKTFDPCVNYTQNKEYNPKGIVTQNITYLKAADIILVNLLELDKSPGTLFELYYAYLNHKPVIAFGTNILYNVQPHVTESITNHFDVLHEALEYIESMFCQ